MRGSDIVIAPPLVALALSAPLFPCGAYAAGISRCMRVSRHRSSQKAGVNRTSLITEAGPVHAGWVFE